jgi:hypothetical protein
MKKVINASPHRQGHQPPLQRVLQLWQRRQVQQHRQQRRVQRLWNDQKRFNEKYVYVFRSKIMNVITVEGFKSL